MSPTLISFRDASPADYSAMALRLEGPSADEWRLGFGKTPQAMHDEGLMALPKGLCRAALNAEGEPLVVYGVNGSPASPGVGMAWFVTSVMTPADLLQLEQHGADEMAALFDHGPYNFLATTVWEGNAAPQFLEALGFARFGSPFRSGPQEAVFLPYLLQNGR